MRKFSKKQYLAAGAAAAVIIAGTGAAYAYWTSTGSGTGSATTGADTAWKVTIDSTTLADLTPNGPVDTVSFHVKNPGTGVQNLQATVAKVVSTSNAGCTATDFSVGTPSITYGEVAANATVDGTFTLQMIDKSGSNQDACKNVTVNLEVDAS